MWIRTSNEKRMYYTEIIEVVGKIVYGNNSIVLGEYESEERAKEVVDQIYKAIEKKYSAITMPTE